MKTIDRWQNEFEIRKIAKLIGDDFVYFKNDDQNRVIIKLIDDCCIAISNEESYEPILQNLVDVLRKHFNSDYCAIGKVDGQIVEDWVISCDENKKDGLENVKRVGLDNTNCCVCKGLKSDDNISYFSEDELKVMENYNVYKDILGEIKYSTIIPIRDRDDVNKGYLQFINSKNKKRFEDVKPYSDSLLRLILVFNQWKELNDAKPFKKDFDFLFSVQNNLDDVDMLLKDIMRHLSKEFNADVVSFRIPLLVGTDKNPLFFLRDCYVNEKVVPFYTRDDYFTQRLLRTVEQMGEYEKLACKNNDSVIKGKAKDAVFSATVTNKQICFCNNTLIIPILRDYSEKEECFRPNNSPCDNCEKETIGHHCFAKYFGVFRLRFLRNSNTPSIDYIKGNKALPRETKKRLSILAKQISILFNAIIKKDEDNSLDILQKELKGTSFTKIKDFDEQCSKIVKMAVQTRNCAIYRYKDGNLSFSASSDPVEDSLDYIINKYGENSNDIIKKLFEQKEPVYFLRIDNDGYGSIMLVPIIGKDNAKLGIMLLVGKEGYDQLWNKLSKTFWEHDKKHIEFIVDLLTRIEESDSERLTFLSQLSHELLRPVTEMVYRNDYNIQTATRNMETYSKEMFIKEMHNNVDMCMMFKYIIDDVEYIYSLSKGDVQYHFEMADFTSIIYDAIKFFEGEAAASKQLTIKADLKNMPEKLYIDKSRMMQVVINLLKNAIQYSYSKEEIFISYEYDAEKDFHEINFSDIGIPVNPKEKDVICNMFFRSKQAVEKRPTGAGIGLYLVKQIMIAHGGDCYVKEFSFPTTFTIQIPN